MRATMDFRSDNTAAIAPVLFDAMASANHGTAAGYGEDAFSAQLSAAFAEFFETEVTAFPVSTGTAANGLALAHLCPPWGRIFAHREAHIERDECGAVSFFTGAQLDLLPGEHAKISADALARHLASHSPSVHSSPPKVLSITQASERGAVYSVDEVSALSAIAHAAGMMVHMDGARFANAVVALDCSPADLSWRAGVDVLCLGATKNGGYACEAVVFFNPAMAADFAYRRKRAGQLGCKSRYVAAQWLAYLDPAVWQTHARHANRCAQIIAAAAQPRLTAPVQTNQVFLSLGDAHKTTLREQGVEFYDWGGADSTEARLVTSWQTGLGDAERLAAMLSALT